MQEMEMSTYKQAPLRETMSRMEMEELYTSIHAMLR